jgi:hypothetical protein
MTASAQMQVNDGALVGCGLRVIAVAQDQSDKVTAVDLSFNLYRSGVSLVKAGVRAAGVRAPKEVAAPPVQKLVTFWARAVGQPATKPDKAGIIKSDSPKGYLLYGATSKSVASLLFAATNGQPIQVGYRLAGEDVDRIVSGTVTETSSEFKEVSQCIDELLPLMMKDADSSDAKGK